MTVPCSFLDEHGQPAICPLERPEHALVQRFVEPNSTGVLELGARYGTTTCEIAKKLQNSGRVVTVDPDRSVWKALEGNLASHNCRAHVVKGIVGNTRHEAVVREDSYASRLPEAAGEPPEGAAVAATPWQEVERKFGVKIDTLLIDCEGCVEYFLKENPGLLDQVKLVLLEGDMGNYRDLKSESCKDLGCLDYENVLEGFGAVGFSVVHEICEPAFFMCHWALKRA